MYFSEVKNTHWGSIPVRGAVDNSTRIAGNQAIDIYKFYK